jgi:hypothetical protein
MVPITLVFSAWAIFIYFRYYQIDPQRQRLLYWFIPICAAAFLLPQHFPRLVNRALLVVAGSCVLAASAILVSVHTIATLTFLISAACMIICGRKIARLMMGSEQALSFLTSWGWASRRFQWQS